MNMTTPIAPVAPKLAKLIPLLGTDRDGELVATVRAIGRTLEAANLTFHDLADAVRPGETPRPKLNETPFMKCNAALDQMHNLSPKEVKFLRDVGQLSARRHTLSAKQLAWLDAIYKRVCEAG